LHGGPVEPRLERLDDELELRQQPLCRTRRGGRKRRSAWPPSWGWSHRRC
jgi:hypothetical protein